MNYKIRVYTGQEIKDIYLNKNTKFVTVGSSEQDTVTVKYPDIIPNHIVFTFQNNEWTCQDNKNSVYKRIEDNDTFVLSMENRVAVSVYFDNIIPQRLVIKANTKVMIGRDFSCAFHLPDRSVGRNHAEFIVDEFGATLRDLNSVNGTYLNNRKITEKAVSDGDIISIGKYTIQYKNNILELCGDISRPSDRREKQGKYPVHNLSPRLRHQMPSDIIQIDAPPNIGEVPTMNWLSFLPMLVTKSPMALVWPIMGCIQTASQKAKYNETKEVREKKYERYLCNVKAKIEKLREDQFLSLEESNHETSRCFDIATRRERILWERSAEDDDFMKVRIGKGDIKTSFQIKFPENVLSLKDDDLEGQGEQLGRGNQILEGAPILCDLFNDLSVGIIGNRQKAISVARNMIVQLTTTHSYKDVKVVSLFSKREAREWEFVKWLPHSFNDSREMRYVANDVFKAATLEKTIDEELKNRKYIDKESSRKENKLPFYLFLVTDPELIEESEIENYLDNATVGAGIGVIYVYDELRDLPKSCNVIVEVGREENEVFHKYNVGEKQKFSIDVFSASKAERFARSLAPVRLSEKKSVADMPTCVTFLEGHGAKRVDELSVLKNWNDDNMTKTAAVPIGVKENGENFIFNMMTKNDFLRYHGSFGLVAGTNGSGKSEMIKSWILSMAAKFPPQYVSFVIMDYKGTGLLLPFKKLPHIAGTISNLDGNVTRNIIALNKEMDRRLELFDKLGIQSDIEEYYAKGYHKTYEMLSRVFVIIDEFAEVKTNLPQFLPVLERVFTIGRSLGFACIVSTQKPSGVVTDKMYTNSKFRWCCRVASSADSKDMLHHTDAAKIKNAGRAFVQIGEDDIYEQVQSFWSGAPYNPERVGSMSVDLPVSMVDITGRRLQYETYKSTEEQSSAKEIDVVVDYIRKVADENNIQDAVKVWLDRLSTRFSLSSIQFNRTDDNFVVPYGMIDNPYEQLQFTAQIDFTNGGHHLVYGLPSTGKTTFLQTCIMSIAKYYSPKEVNIYGLDFGSWSLNLFSSLPHMGGVANDNDEQKVKKLVDMITNELNTRKKKFLMNGVINIKAYNQSADEKLPYIVLMIDSFSSLFSLYQDLEDFFIRLSKEGAGYGIYILATTGANGGVSYKITSNIKSNIALQLKESSDYTSIVGKTNNLEPESTEGRGLVKYGSRVLEFQIALPADGRDDGEVLENIKADVKRIVKQYCDCKAKQIPVMPKVIHYSSISSNKIALGLSVKDITPVELDVNAMPHYMVISGAPGCGADSLMKLIIKQFYDKENAKVVLYDNGTGDLADLKNISDRYILTVDELDMYFENLSKVLKERNDIKLSGDGNFDTILIAIDGYKTMYEAILDETANRISAFLRKGRGLKVYLLVSEASHNMGALCAKEPIMRNIVEEGVGLLVGGSYYSHTVFKSDLKYLESNEVLGKNEAYFVCSGKATKFKAISES